MTENELRQKFVNTAIAYLGSNKGGAKHKEIIDTYNSIVPLPQNYKVKYTDPWCATFASFCAYKSGLQSIFPLECSCPRMVALAQKMGIWVENDAYVPKAGDVIMYDWEDNGVGDNTGVPDHVGIVVSVSGNTIKVIEGNKGNSVGYRNLAVNGRYIRGYIVPKFASKATEKENTNTGAGSSASVNVGSGCNVKLNVLTKGSTGEQVRALQILLVGRGFSVGSYGADGSFGNATLSAVKSFQKAKGLAVDGSVGEATWGALLGK